MTILDSDVLLTMISTTHDTVDEWVKGLHSKPHTTALAVAEVYAAVKAEPRNLFFESRQRELRNVLDGFLHRRVLPFDVACAERLASLSVTRHPEVGPYALAVLIHAATAQHLRMPLVTGRPEEFAGLDVEVVPLDLS